MTSLLRTKNGSPEPSINLSLARARGPAVPSGSVSCEQVILMSSFFSNSTYNENFMNGIRFLMLFESFFFNFKSLIVSEG